jgi:hypothetical protein
MLSFPLPPAVGWFSPELGELASGVKKLRTCQATDAAKETGAVFL